MCSAYEDPSATAVRHIPVKYTIVCKQSHHLIYVYVYK